MGKVMVCLSILTNVMLFAMGEQLASWMPSLYRQATEQDVLGGRVASVIGTADGDLDLVMRWGKGRYVVLISVVCEHIVGLMAAMLAFFIPRQPEWVHNEVARLQAYKDLQAKR